MIIARCDKMARLAEGQIEWGIVLKSEPKRSNVLTPARVSVSFADMNTFGGIDISVRASHVRRTSTVRIYTEMANARQQKQPKALIRCTLESARREIEQIERKFHRTIRAVQNGGFSTGRRSTKAATARTRSAAGRSMGRPAPVQTAVTNVLKKRRTGLTLDRLQAALPKFDEKSLLNATFAMRRKGLITFEKNGKGRGKYRWQD